MKLVFDTKNKNKVKTYFIRLPNYYDTEKVDELLEDVRFEIPKNEKIVAHQFYGDTALTLDERKQLDDHGEIINPLIELSLTR